MSRVRHGDEGQRVSGGYARIRPDAITPDLRGAWKSPDIVPRQRALVDDELQRMYAGDVVPPCRVMGEAVMATGMRESSLLEVGRATGYHYEVLTHVLPFSVEYRGLDYSEALIDEARRHYPGVAFDVGDATDLPYKDASFDIVVSGASFCASRIGNGRQPNPLACRAAR